MKNTQKIIAALSISLLFQSASAFAEGQYYVEEDFKDNTIEASNPVGVYVSSSALKNPDEIFITDREASGNTLNGVSMSTGGLINSGSSKLVVSNSKFLNNAATTSNGSVYSAIMEGKNIEVSGSEFTGNSASMNAASGNFMVYGVVSSVRGTNVAAFDNSKFDSNSAKSSYRVQGGVFQVSNGGTLNITNSSFTNNTAEAVNKTRGTIENYNGNLNISNTVFENNSVSNSTVLGTLRGAFGGAVYSSESNAVTTLTDVSFIGNSANKGYGGAVCVEGGSTLNLKVQKNAVFSGNYTTNSSGEKVDSNGGFLYTTESSKVNFDIDEGAILTIGDGTSGYDSIAATKSSNSVISKIGAGEMVVNSSMSDYKSNLNVNEGTMTVNGGLGANVLSIASGASFVSTGAFDIGTLSVSSNGKISLAEGSTFDVLQINYESELSDGDIFSISDICVGELTESIVCSVLESGAEYKLFDKNGVEWEAHYQDGSFAIGNIPEPSAYAAILGAIALAFAAYRRRK